MISVFEAFLRFAKRHFGGSRGLHNSGLCVFPSFVWFCTIYLRPPQEAEFCFPVIFLIDNRALDKGFCFPHEILRSRLARAFFGALEMALSASRQAITKGGKGNFTNFRRFAFPPGMRASREAPKWPLAGPGRPPQEAGKEISRISVDLRSRPA